MKKTNTLLVAFLALLPLLGIFTKTYAAPAATAEADSLVSSPSTFTYDTLVYRIYNNEAIIMGMANDSMKGALIIPDSIAYEGINYPVTTIGMYSIDSPITSVDIPVTLKKMYLISYKYTSDMALGMFSRQNISKITLHGGEELSSIFPTSIYQFICPFNVLCVPKGTKEYYKTIVMAEFCYAIVEEGETDPFVTVDSLTYMLEDGVAMLARQDQTMVPSHVVVPSSIEHNGTQYPVKRLLKYPFYNCDNIESVELAEGITALDGCTFYDCNNMKSVKLPETLTDMGDDIFFACHSLTSIEIPKGVTELNSCTFYYCTSMTELICLGEITKLGESCFLDCSSLASYKIPGSVTTIGAKCFGNCSALSEVEIPSSVTSIGEDAFLNCSALDRIVVNWTEPIEADSSLLANIPLTYLFVPNGTKAAYEASSTWNKCVLIVEGDEKDNVTEANIGGLRYCLTNGKAIVLKQDSATISGDIVIPASVYDNGATYTVCEIGKYAFSDCSNLTGITIPESVTSVGNYAFSRCSSLSSIVIPNSVTNIGNSCFIYCRKLAYVKLSDALKTLNEDTFWDCLTLTSIDIPALVTSIGDYCFYSCDSLNTVTLPEGLTSIGNCCFENCNNLDYLNIPKSVSYIGFAFIGVWLGSAPDLSLTVNWDDPSVCECHSDIFSDTNCINLYVPKGSKSLYEASSVWSIFENITEYEVTSIETISEPYYETRIIGNQLYVSGAEEGLTVKVYTMDGRIIGQSVVKDATATLPEIPVRKMVIIKIGQQVFKLLK